MEMFLKQEIPTEKIVSDFKIMVTCILFASRGNISGTVSILMSH